MADDSMLRELRSLRDMALRRMEEAEGPGRTSMADTADHDDTAVELRVLAWRLKRRARQLQATGAYTRKEELDVEVQSAMLKGMAELVELGRKLVERTGHGG